VARTGTEDGPVIPAADTRRAVGWVAVADGAVWRTTVDEGATLVGVVAAYGVFYEPKQTVTHPCEMCYISDMSGNASRRR